MAACVYNSTNSSLLNQNNDTALPSVVFIIHIK